MAKPFQNKWRGPPSGRKRRYSDMVDSYYGPQEFIEAGFRGFLLTTEPCCEENSLDIAIRILRQAAVKVYGAVQKDGPDITDWTGFVKYEIGEHTKVKLLMDEGDTEKGAEEKKGDKQDDKENKNEGSGEDGEAQEKNVGEKDEEKEDDASKVETNEDKIEEPMEHMPNEGKVSDERATSEKDSEKTKEESDARKGEEEDVKKTEKEDNEKEEDDDVKNDANEKDKKAEKKKDEDKSKQSERKSDKNSKDQSRRKSPEKKREPMRQWYPRFKGPYKFKAFRTELRNLMFIQSDVPDPTLVLATLYDSFDSSWIGRQKGKVDLEGINQLMPVLGVCNNNCHQLEIMSRRVLASIFDESFPPKTFSVLLFDAMSEPGSELLIETVRNAIWSLNPATLQASPLVEPDVVIRLEVIGSKLVLCCMTGFMKYREYTPVHLHWLGQGEGEDDDGSFSISKNFQFDRARKQERKRERRLEQEKKDKEKEKERKSEKSEKTQEEKSENKLREERAKSAEGAEKEKHQKVEDKPEDGQTQAEDEVKMEGISAESVTTLPSKKRKSDAIEEMEMSSGKKEEEEEDADISGVTDATEEEAAQEQEEEEEVKKTTPKKKATRGRRTGTRKAKK